MLCTQRARLWMTVSAHEAARVGHEMASPETADMHE